MKRILTLLLFIGVGFATSQTDDLIYYQNFVYLENGSVCTDKPPDAAFFVYLNNDFSRILTQDAPRWKANADPNINGKGMFGIELGNFSTAVEVGDTVTVVFTSATHNQQGVLNEIVFSLPWYRFPQLLYLQQRNIPARPESIRLFTADLGQNRLEWHRDPAVTYTLFRRNLADTLENGRARMEYQRIAQGIDADHYIDSESSIDDRYGYILLAVDAEGLMSMPSADLFRPHRSIDLSAQLGSRNVILNWTAVDDDEITGYNIYRYKPGESPLEPIAYTGLDTVYTDTRLRP
ncbi:fibronectin type III domain-containing protein, partial [candidate division KSB1 bacterium]|nr:fibronectin type III domain-containing protein [candidate division KSB1 bacterium]